MITVQATYEDGVFKPAQTLPLRDHEMVELTVRTINEKTFEQPEEADEFVRRSQGLVGWTGDATDLRRLAESSEFDPQEGP